MSNHLPEAPPSILNPQQQSYPSDGSSTHHHATTMAKSSARNRSTKHSSFSSSSFGNDEEDTTQSQPKSWKMATMTIKRIEEIVRSQLEEEEREKMDLQSQLDEERRRKEDLQSLLEKERRGKEDLQSRLDEERQGKERLQSRLVEDGQDMEDIRSQLEVERRRTENLQFQLNEERRAQRRLEEGEIYNAETEIANHRYRLLAQERKEKEVLRSQLDEMKNKYEAEKTDLENSLAELQDSLNGFLNHQTATSSDEVAVPPSRKKWIPPHLRGNKMKGQQGSFKSVHDRMVKTDKIKALQQSTDDTKRGVSKLDRKLKKEQAKCAKLSSKVESLEGEREELSTKVEILEGGREELLTKVQNLEGERKELEKKYPNDVFLLYHALSQLQYQTIELKKKVQKANWEKAVIANRGIQLEEERQKLDDQCELMTNEIRILSLEKGDLEYDAAGWKSERDYWYKVRHGTAARFPPRQDPPPNYGRHRDGQESQGRNVGNIIPTFASYESLASLV